MIEFKRSYRDVITHYEGVATARTEYLFGLPSIRLTRLSKDGKPEHEWFPEEQLELVGSMPVGTTAGFGGRTEP